MVMKKVKIIGSNKLVSSERGSIFFPLSHPLLPTQPFAWVLVELAWSEPTFIEPFLEDVREYLQTQVAALKTIDEESVSKLYQKIKSRFIDWQLTFILVFKRGNQGFRIFTCGDGKSYLLSKNGIKEVPLHSECGSFLFTPLAKADLLLTSNQLPLNLQVSDPYLFSQELKKQGRGFILLTTFQERGNFQRWLKKKMVYFFLPIVLGVTVISAIKLSFYFSRHHQPRPIIPQDHQLVSSSERMKIDSLLQRVEVTKKTDPEQAKLLLQQVKVLARKNNLMDRNLWQRIHSLEVELGNKKAATALLYLDNYPFFPLGGKEEDNSIFLFDKKRIVRLAFDNETVKLSPLVTSSQPILDFIISDEDIYYLTYQGVFRWRKGKIQQLHQLPKESQPAKLAAYNQNLYLLTTEGEVYKYLAGQQRYPVDPSLYFFSAELKGVKKMIVAKKFYFLTQGGSLIVYYFGKKQAFSFSRPIQPLSDIFFSQKERKFYFLNAQGWGSFDLIGQVSQFHQLPNSYNYLFPLGDKMIFLADNQVFVQKK